MSMNTNLRSVRVRIGAGMGSVVALCAAAPLLADAPLAVTIATHVEFNPDVYGTFVATGPICPTGTVNFVDDVVGSGPAAFNVNGTVRFICDDNSGSFVLRVHPQAASRSKDGFDLAGPWSVWGKGTGAYEGLAGHGDFGVVFDFNNNPLTGEETYVGFVTL